jgi:hypothetical protein
VKLRSGSGPVDRDWFGLDAFLPGPRFTRDGGQLYLLDEVGSTNDFLRGRGPEAVGRLCRWDGWGWVAQTRSRLAPVRELRPGSVVVGSGSTPGASIFRYPFRATGPHSIAVSRCGWA